MSEALFDLEHVLRSKQVKLSSQEVNVLMACKANALREFIIGAGAGGAIAWLAMGKLRNLVRINIAGGAAAATGLWRFGQSLDSCIERILCMDGSRLQNELANIMLKKYPNDPTIRPLISKRFYREDVFDDSTTDMPKSRWRFRNSFVEDAAHSQKTDNCDPYDRNLNVDSENKPVSMNSGFVVMENPFDCAFGVPPTIGEIHHPVSSTASRRKHSRRQRRSQRRHQLHNQEFPATSHT